MSDKAKAQIAVLALVGLLSVNCTTYRYLGRSVCVAPVSHTRVPYSSRVHIIRAPQKFVPANTITKPAVLKGEKLNKREIRKRYFLQ